jgi:hypothetical protein
VVLQPVVVDHTAIRCPDVTPEVRAEAERTVPTPKPPINKDRDRKWHDDQDRAIADKNAVIKTLISDRDACRGSVQPSNPS